jgi:hypothetical protein
LQLAVLLEVSDRAPARVGLAADVCDLVAQRVAQPAADVVLAELRVELL